MVSLFDHIIHFCALLRNTWWIINTCLNSNTKQTRGRKKKEHLNTGTSWPYLFLLVQNKTFRVIISLGESVTIGVAACINMKMVHYGSGLEGLSYLANLHDLLSDQEFNIRFIAAQLTHTDLHEWAALTYLGPLSLLF